MLDDPIAPTLLGLAIPNLVVAAAQTAVAMADAWYVGQLGVAPLAALALVFPLQSLMTMMSTGAMGGGIASAIARALGAGDIARAERIPVHGLVIAIGMAALFTLLLAVFARPVFALLGGTADVLDGVVAYAQVAFGGAAVIWLANTLAAILRGTGNTLLPGIIFTLAAALNITLSGALALGWWGAPKLGIAGPAVAFVTSQLAVSLALFAYLARGGAGFRLRLVGVGLDWPIFRDILKVGLVACGIAFLTVATIVIVTALVARYGTAALAGYGLGSRLELLLIPIASSFGGAMTAMVGANRGARAYARARRIAWTGGLTVCAITGLIGLTVAIAPDLWIGLFTTSAPAAEVGRRYFAIAGPFFACFGLGQALYFATQGTGNMTAPLAAGCARLLLAAGGGAVASILIGAPLDWLFACVALGLVVFGAMLAWAVARGTTWNPDATAGDAARGG